MDTIPYGRQNITEEDIEAVVAVPEDSMSHVSVDSTVNIEALLGIVSDVSSATTIEGKSLVDFVSVWSGNSSNSDSESLSLLVGKGKSSVGESSNSS